MLHLTVSPWELITRALVVYFFLIIALRLTGKRQIGQLAPFDLVLLLILSNSVQNSINAGDNSLSGGLISALTLVMMNYAMGWLAFKSKTAANFIEGRPELIVHNGRVNHHILNREQISVRDLDSAMHRAGCGSLQEVQFAILESNGSISILKKGA